MRIFNLTSFIFINTLEHLGFFIRLLHRYSSSDEYASVEASRTYGNVKLQAFARMTVQLLTLQALVSPRFNNIFILAVTSGLMLPN